MVTIADLPRTGNADQTIWSEISKFQAILVISRVWLVRTSFLSLTQIQLPKLLVKSTQSDTKLFPENVFFRKTPKSTKLRTSEDSVSTSLRFYFDLVDDPHLQPRKDYDDYTRFINDTYAEEKEDMLNQTVTNLSRTGGFDTMPSYNPIHTLRTYSEKPRIMGKRNLKGRNLSVGGPLN